MTVSGHHNKLEEPFYVLATQNPIEMEGTYPLPEAQMDRFLYKLLVPFPDEADLLSILGAQPPTSRRNPKRSPGGRRSASSAISSCRCPSRKAWAVLAAKLVLLTHPEHPDSPDFIRQYVRYGSSPRGAQSLILTQNCARCTTDATTHPPRTSWPRPFPRCAIASSST